MTLTTNSSERARPRDRFIQAIAIFKFVKAALFILAALGAFGLMQQGVAERARDWGAALAFTSGQHLVRHAIVFVTGLSRQRIGALGLVALFYAALFATEGIGLWKEKRWAEYLTVIATGSLIPLEIWETAHRATPMKFATLAVNIAMVIYLIVRLRRPREEPVARPHAPTVARQATAAQPEPEQSTAG